MKLLDVVSTVQDLPELRLAKAQVGTIVEDLDEKHVLVEFADLDGVAFATVSLPVEMLTVEISTAAEFFKRGRDIAKAADRGERLPD